MMNAKKIVLLLLLLVASGYGVAMNSHDNCLDLTCTDEGDDVAVSYLSTSQAAEEDR